MQTLRERLGVEPTLEAVDRPRTDAVVDSCPWCHPAVTGQALFSLLSAAPKVKAWYFPGLKISRAGDTSSNPGGFWIADEGPFGDSTYYGSIRADGEIRMTRALYAAGNEREQLKRLAAFGTAEIVRIGIATGRCCYCGRRLTDAISIELGYGPVCAKHHRLPHGKKAVAARAA